MREALSQGDGDHRPRTAVPADIAAALAEPEYRVEGPLKVAGRARYAADIQLPGMLWAKFLRSPHAHALIRSIDTSAARALPGVHAVITGADVGPKRVGKVLWDWPILAYEKVRYIGERVAAVAAESPQIAEEAVRLIQVEYEEIPAVFDAEEALAEGAPIIHPAAAEYRYEPGKRPPVPHPNLQGYRLITKDDSDLDRIFAEADVVVEDTFLAARQHQGYIEPRACVVWIDPAGIVHIHSTNKAPFVIQHQMAIVTGLPAERIVVDSMFIGGDFGGKGHSIEEFPCYFLAAATGRPIKSVMSYAEELESAAPRHGAKFHLRTAVGKDGRILAHESRVYYDDGAYAGARPLPGPILDGWSALEVYAVPHARLETFMVYTNKVPGGQMRAPGAAHTGFVGESHIDHIARELGMDPLDFRILNAVREGRTGPTGERVQNPQAVEVLEALKRESGWKTHPLPANHGRGISLRSRDVGAGRAEILIRLRPDGMIEAIHGAPDQGGGSATLVRRVSAAVLSVSPDRVIARYGTTAEAPLNPGPGGSRLTRVLGQATIAGATDLKNKLEELAAEVMGWPAAAVQLRDDRFITTDGSGESAAYEEVVARILRGGTVEGFGAYDSAEHVEEDEGIANYCAYMIEVEVDPDTGQVRPVEALEVVDVGTVINPIAHSGQLEGGFVFGLGNAVMEELEFADGRVSTLTLGDYKLPTHMDVPPLRVVMLPSASGPGPFGAKAAGELTNNAVAPAIANAVEDAVGVRVRTMPITAERVYAALHGNKP
ncbi:MAG TPA: xanthine dehydrogenase family protein molybdopterin-binding subunit [Chloroflexota bacterium]|nr:xanthine dehydrogenase family protein molybdopterin-binding subunit [Chloroflexota bacterium]